MIPISAVGLRRVPSEGQKVVVGSVTSPYSHYPIAGKHLSSSGVSGGGAELRVYGSVLNVLVAQPVFGKVDVFAGVEYVGSDGMFEGMKLLPLGWQSGGTAVLLHQHQQGAPIDGQHPVGYKKVGGSVFPAVEVGADEFHCVRCHRVGAGHGPFDSVDGDHAIGIFAWVGWCTPSKT